MSKTYNFEVTYLEDDMGRIAVVPSPDWIKRNVTYSESMFGDSRELTAKATKAFDECHQSEFCKTMTFQMRPYTYGEKLEAGRKATGFSMGESRTDSGLMNLYLLEAVTGKSRKELEELPTQIIHSVFEEMSFISEPDSDRLLFLLAKPTTGDSQAEHPES